MLSGGEEARLSAQGVVSGFHKPDGVVGDLGGGSLEVVDVHDDRTGEGETFPLGGIRLEEASDKSLKKAEKIVAEALDKSKVLVKGEKRPLLRHRRHLALAGAPAHAPEGLSAPCHAPLLHRRRRSRRLLPDGRPARSRIARLDRGGVAQPPSAAAYGAVVLEQVIKMMKPSEIVMSALGVREGLLYDLLGPDEQAKDPLIVACEELAYLRSRSPRHVHELGPWSEMVFRAIGLDETEEEARLRHAACLLTDIGWRAHPEYRGEQSLNLIAHAAFIGIDHPGRAYLALANFYRHEGLIDEQLSPRIRELASTRLMERARALGATLRVGHIISAATPGVVGRTRVEQRGKTLMLVLPEDLAPLGGARVLRRFGQIAKFAGLEPAITAE